MEYFITAKKSSEDMRIEFTNFMEENFPDIRFEIGINYKMLRYIQYHLYIKNPYDLKNYSQISERLDPENTSSSPINTLIDIFLDNLYPESKSIWYKPSSVIVYKNPLIYDIDFNIPEDIKYYINNNLKNPLYILDRDGYLSNELSIIEGLDSILIQTQPASANFAPNIVGNYAFTGFKVASRSPLLTDYFSTYVIPDAPSIFVDLVKNRERVLKRIYIVASQEILSDKELWANIIFPVLNCPADEFDEFIRSFKTEESLEKDAMRLVYTINRRTKEKLKDLQSKQTITSQRINDLIYEVGALQADLRTFRNEYVSTLHGSRNRKYIIKKILGEFQNILNLPEVTDVRVAFEEESSICVDIEALPCESGERVNVEPPVLGPYTLEIEPHTLSIRILNSGNPREGYAHPHCSNGDVPCFGDFTDIHGMITDGEYTSAVAQIIHGFLRCYNIHDQWGKHIFFWSPHYGFESLISSGTLGDWDLSDYADEYFEIYGSNIYEDYTCEYCHEPLDYCICVYCSDCGDRISECECERCPNCNELIDDCECNRCSECGELDEDCCCERCDVCGALIGDCECERCPDCGEFVEDCECEYLEESEENPQEECQEESQEEPQSETTRACNTCGAILHQSYHSTRCLNCLLEELHCEGIPITRAVVEACHRQLTTLPQTVETSF